MEGFGIAMKKSVVVKSKYGVRLLQTEPKVNNLLKGLTPWKKIRLENFSWLTNFPVFWNIKCSMSVMFPADMGNVKTFHKILILCIKHVF